jgi:hypothetical protein
MKGLVLVVRVVLLHENQIHHSVDFRILRITDSY